MTGQNTNNLSDAIRNLIVCDTQFGWTGETTLKLPELLDLQARGWLIEGDENCEFSLTDEGQAVVARALQQDAPAELAEQQGLEWNDSARLAYLEYFAREPGGLLLHAESKTGRRGLGLGENCGNRTLAQAIDGCASHAEKARFSALAATGKQQVGEVRGDALCTELLVHADGLESTAAGDRETGESIEQAIEDGEGYTPDEPQDIAAGLQHDADRAEHTAALLRKAAAALAARQPVGQEPIELSGIADALSEGGGVWRTCSGCHESNEGVPTGPYSHVMKCHLGTGCSECGGVGAIWDDTDYQAWSDQMVQSLAAPPAQGIDLGKLRALAEQWKQLEYPFSYEGQQAQRAADACRADLLALLDGPRDAAPGVRISQGTHDPSGVGNG